MRTIQIDDAGTGDVVGDAFIGFYVVETGELIFKNIPVELFNEDNWKNKVPFKIVVDIVKEGLKELNFKKETEKIKICRGNFFEQVRTYFDEEGINYEQITIEGKLQDAVEDKLVNYLRELGVGSRNLTKESGAKRFFVLYNWVCRDFKSREKYVKSGFPAWKKVWKEKAIKDSNRFKNYKRYHSRDVNPQDK